MLGLCLALPFMISLEPDLPGAVGLETWLAAEETVEVLEVDCTAEGLEMVADGAGLLRLSKVQLV